MTDTPPKKPRTRRPYNGIARQTGITEIADPLLRFEAKKAGIWLGMAALMALVVLLAQPLLVVFGGLVFAAMIDGGARLIGRVIKIGRIWRVAIVLLLTALFIGWLVLFAGSQIAEQASQLPNTVKSQALRAVGWPRSHGVAIDAKVVQGIIEQAMGGMSQVTRVVGGLIGGATTLILIVVLGIYFALEPQMYERGLAWLLPRDSRTEFHGTVLAMGHSLRRLLAGRLLGMAVEGFTIWVLLSLYGVPMAALLGLLTALLAFFPNIGAPISGALMVLVGFSGGTHMGLYCIGVFVAVVTIDGNIVVPLVARRAVDLAPALVLGMQLIMGALFGIIGLALADPLVAMLKVLIERQSDRKNEAPAAEV